VAREPLPVAYHDDVGEHAFACDAMLGALARWLRFAGFDVRYDPAISDAALAGLAQREGRWLLTRDRALASAAGPRVLLLRASAVTDQVAEVRDRLDLTADEGRFFTRCSRCNGALSDIDPAEAASRVPPYVAAHASRFRACAGCGRIYWAGTHHARIAARLHDLFG
jgi:uncharacterized protein with PIN domain